MTPPDAAPEEERRRLTTGRQYDVSPLPTIRPGPPPPPEDRERLYRLYDQVCASWRELVGVRFRLLALVPPVSLALLTLVLSDSTTTQLTSIRRTIIVVSGLLATLGLLIYDTRNSALHDDLISRGRRIESELGIDTGQFLGRRRPASWLVRHWHATFLVYAAALLAWVAALVAIWLGR